MLLDLRLSASLCGHVRVERHKAVVWNWHAPHPQHGAVGARAFHVVRREHARRLHALVDIALAVAIAVFATFCVEADEALKRRADEGHFHREIEQGEKRQIPRHHVQIFIDQRVPLVDQVQAGLK